MKASDPCKFQVNKILNFAQGFCQKEHFLYEKRYGKIRCAVADHRHYLGICLCRPAGGNGLSRPVYLQRYSICDWQPVIVATAGNEPGAANRNAQNPAASRFENHSFGEKPVLSPVFM
jgi:hypothetical protein